MPIEFKCHYCGGSLRVADEYAERHGRCPFCRKLIKTPTTGQPANEMTDSTQRITDAILAEAAPSSVLTPPERKAVASASAPAKKTPAPAPLPKPGKDAIRFECLLCGSKISVGKEMAGKKMACPSCGEVLTAPSE